MAQKTEQAKLFEEYYDHEFSVNCGDVCVQLCATDELARNVLYGVVKAYVAEKNNTAAFKEKPLPMPEMDLNKKCITLDYRIVNELDISNKEFHEIDKLYGEYQQGMVLATPKIA